MTRRLIAALLAAAAAPTLAQPVAPQVANLRDAALADNYAWEITEGLTTEVGQRMAGTEAEARARTWAVAKLKAMGFSNVRVDPFTMPVWVRGSESASIVAPFPQKLVIAALGNSGSTPMPSSGLSRLSMARCARARSTTPSSMTVARKG